MFVLTDLRHRRLLLVPALDAPAGALARVPPASIGPLTAPMAPVIRDGHIALADHGTDRVVVHTPSTNEWHAFPTGPWPRSIAIDDNSAVYVAGRRLERFDDLDGTNPTTIIDAGANAPMAVAATGVFDLDVTMSDGTLRRSHDAGVTWQSVDLQGATRTAPTAIASMFLRVRFRRGCGAAFWLEKMSGFPQTQISSAIHLPLREGIGHVQYSCCATCILYCSSFEF